MIGYKGTDFNGYCKNLQYKVGETYSLDGELKICKSGFHFCKNLINVDNYYSFCNQDYEYYEIEALGNIITEGDKSVTDKIKIIRKLSKKDIEEISKNNIKYNEFGKLIYFKFNKFWLKIEYNKQGKIINFKDSQGFLYRKEYNKYGLEIWHEDSNGYFREIKYDERGNIILIKDPTNA
jgi:YD repeat-containing protein